MRTLSVQLLDLDNSREAVYGTLDAWVAWERTFPIVSLKSVLLTLEKEQQWHRVVQVSLSLPLHSPFKKKKKRAASLIFQSS